MVTTRTREFVFSSRPARRRVSSPRAVCCRGLLFGITALDLSPYVSVIVGLVAVGGAACLSPGARATRGDPLESMRAE